MSARNVTFNNSPLIFHANDNTMDHVWMYKIIIIKRRFRYFIEWSDFRF